MAFTFFVHYINEVLWVLEVVRVQGLSEVPYLVHSGVLPPPPRLSEVLTLTPLHSFFDTEYLLVRRLYYLTLFGTKKNARPGSRERRKPHLHCSTLGLHCSLIETHQSVLTSKTEARSRPLQRLKADLLRRIVFNVFSGQHDGAKWPPCCLKLVDFNV